MILPIKNGSFHHCYTRTLCLSMADTINMKQLPILLIYTRLVLGPLIIILSALQVTHYNIIAISIIVIGVLSDIFDGIIARRLQISTQKLRRLDSSADQIFFMAEAVATYLQCPDFFKTHSLQIAILLGFEGLTYIVCFIKFRKEIATHSFGAKLWTLVLCATLIEIVWHCQSAILFEICFWFGLVTRLEIIAIILTLKAWTNDVPTIYHARQLRLGKAIKRHKLFNG